MIALLLENLKLIMLFLLVGSIIGLSHLADGNRDGSRFATVERTYRSAKGQQRRSLV
jgi:hypothetical protein